MGTGFIVDCRPFCCPGVSKTQVHLFQEMRHKMESTRDFECARWQNVPGDEIMRKISGLREYFAGQITIQCSEGSPATGQHPRNENWHDIGECMISSGSFVE
jgi:hypothetical protein